MFKISHRLLCAVAEIGVVNSLADIGTDHGQLVIYALDNGIAQKAYAVDISEKSLSKAKKAIEERNLQDKVEFVLGDGLTGLTEAPDAVIIAGIGGFEIVNILKKTSIDAKFIFIPHNDADVLRAFLCGNGFEIIHDYIIKDGKFYAVITAVRGKTTYTRSQILFGANNPYSEAFYDRLRERKRKIEKIMQKQSTALEQLKFEIREEYEEICKCLK